MVSLDPDRPEIIRLLQGASALSVDQCIRLVRRYMRSQHHATDASAASWELIGGVRAGDPSTREARIATARLALDRVSGVLDRVPEEVQEGEFIVPLRGIAEQAVHQAVQGLLVREALPPRFLRALLEPFDGFVDGLALPATDGPARR